MIRMKMGPQSSKKLINPMVCAKDSLKTFTPPVTWPPVSGIWMPNFLMIQWTLLNWEDVDWTKYGFLGFFRQKKFFVIFLHYSRTKKLPLVARHICLVYNLGQNIRNKVKKSSRQKLKTFDISTFACFLTAIAKV